MIALQRNVATLRAAEVRVLGELAPFDLGIGEGRQMRSIPQLRIEPSKSRIRSTR
jgi:hypothetical protein